MNNKKNGYTMIEFIVVIAIIAILSSIIIPVSVSYINKSRNDSEKTSVQNLAIDTQRALNEYQKQDLNIPQSSYYKDKIILEGDKKEKRRVYLLNELYKNYNENIKILITSDIENDPPKILTEELQKKINVNRTLDVDENKYTVFDKKEDYSGIIFIVYLNDKSSNYIVTKYENFYLKTQSQKYLFTTKMA